MILFVEDNTRDRLLIQSILSQWEHKERITFVIDGPQAVSYLRECSNLPSVVIIDLHLPQLSGLELVKALRANSDYYSLPIVVFSSSSSPLDIENCYRAGTNAYVIKSIDFTQFSKSVKHIVDFWVYTNTK